MDPELAYKRTVQMFDEGANIVDIGGEATNPHAEPITADEEWQRLKPIVERVLPAFNQRISIDTHHPETVERVARYGRFIVNDITTFQNPDMIKMAAHFDLRCIASHLPLAAEGDIKFAHDFMALNDTSQVTAELLQQRRKMVAGGIIRRNIILDPGIGFGKDMARNWELLDFPRQLTKTALMIGYSHKRFLATYPDSGTPNPNVDKNDIDTNLAAGKRVIISANRWQNPLWLRVHDVAPHRALIVEMTSRERWRTPNRPGKS